MKGQPQLRANSHFIIVGLQIQSAVLLESAMHRIGYALIAIEKTTHDRKALPVIDSQAFIFRIVRSNLQHHGSAANGTTVNTSNRLDRFGIICAGISTGRRRR